MSQERENPKDFIGDTKVALCAVPPASLIYEALARMDGDMKYGFYNFRDKRVSCMVYLNAAARHILAYLDGEECAADTGIPHLGGAKASLGIVIDAFEGGYLIDDRPSKGSCARLLEKFRPLIARLRNRTPEEIASGFKNPYPTEGEK
jgi:hypothetical protein